MTNEQEITLLDNVYSTIQEYPDANQRQISNSLGLSLGMTNLVLKRFAEKGLIYMKKINSKNIKYVLTNEGANELKKRSSAFVKRTLNQVSSYKERVFEFCEKAKANGAKKIILLGKDDISFIIEYACLVNSLEYENIVDASLPAFGDDALVLASESVENFDKAKELYGKKFFCIFDIIVGFTGEN